MKYIAAIVLLTACHHELKTDAHVVDAEQVKTAKTVETAVAETRKQDASDVDTKTTKSDNAIIVQDEDGSAAVVVVTKDKPLALKKGSKVIGTVPVSQTVVDQSKRIGATETEKNVSKKSAEVADTDKHVTVVAHEEESSDVGFSTKFYLLAGGVLIAVSALGFFLAHSKLVRRLLGEPL